MEKVLLTGASSGIGNSIAQKLVANGYEVIACVRKEADKQALEAMSPKITAVILDVTDCGAIGELFKSLKTQNIKLSGIINNAGIAVAGVMEYPDIDAIKHQLEVNTFAPLRLTTTLLPLMDEGKIINISSVSSNFVYPFIAPYCTSKRALDILFQALSVELNNDKIKIISIKPGVIKTPLWDKSINMAKENFSKVPEYGIKKYENKINNLLKSLENSIKNGLAPEAVSNVVLKAMKSKKPKGSYNVGAGAYVGEFLSKLSVDLQRKLIRFSI